MIPRAWLYLAAAGMLVAAMTWSHGAAYRRGVAGERASWQAVEQARVDAINAERLEQARKLDKLHVEIEVLRARPERVRTVIREVKVHADADCSSLPGSWRLLWDAAADPGPAGAAATVDDAGVPAVAGDRR